MMDFSQIIWTHFLQLTLVAGVVGIIGWAARYRAPRLMHGLWLLVLLKCLVPPVIQHPLSNVVQTEVQLPIVDTAATRTASPERKSFVEKDEAVLPRLDLPLSDPGKTPNSFHTADARRGQEEQPGGLDTGEGQPTSAPAMVSGYKESAASDTPSSVTIAIPNVAAREPSRWRSPWLAVVAIWLTGSCVLLSHRIVIYGRMHRKFARSVQEAPRWTRERTEELRKHLGVRGSVTLGISEDIAAPQVMGLISPMIALPAEFFREPRAIAEADRERIDPILAHELIHIRRHDLWTGVLQNLAVSLWWFHPLVWWASRQLSIQAELICDENVVRGLPCKPSDYATRLLGVIEAAANSGKAQPYSRSIAPSMSAFGKTRRRLERIMKTKPQRRIVPSVISASVVLAFAAIALPGDFTARAQESATKDSRKRHASEPAPKKTPAKTPANIPVADAVPNAVAATGESRSPEKIELRKYDCDALIANRIKQGRIKEQIVKQNLDMTLQAHLRGWESQQEPEPKAVWIGRELNLFATPSQHETAEAYLNETDWRNTPQLSVNARFFKADHKVIESIFKSIGTKWYAIPNAAIPDAGLSDGSDATNRSNIDQVRFARWRASSTQQTTSSIPLLISFFDQNEMGALVSMVQEKEGADLTQAPKVALFDSQQASIQTAGRQSFVTSVSWQPAEGTRSGVEVFRKGLLLRVMPHLLDRDVVGLRFACEQSDIPDVTNFDLPTTDSLARIQSPHISTKQFAAELISRTGDTVVLAWLEPQANSKTSVRLVALTSDVIEYAGKFSEQQKAWTLPSDHPAEAMRSGLVPLRHFPGLESFVKDEPKKETSALKSVPLPASIQEKLNALGIEIAAQGLSGLQLYEGKIVDLEADSIHVAIEDTDNELLDSQSLEIRSTRLRMSFSEERIEFEFADNFQTKGDNYQISAGSGSLRFGRTGEDQSGFMDWSFGDGVLFETSDDEMRVRAERFRLSNSGWAAEGDATLDCEYEPGKRKQLKGNRIEISEDFPALIIERDKSAQGPRAESKTVPSTTPSKFR